MIVNKKNALLETLSRMEKSKIEFYLTGSRFFNLENSQSDFDFFVSNTSDVQEFLYKEGFRLLSLDSSYKELDILTRNVWRKDFPPTNIDIQICIDPELKSKVQRYLYKIFDIGSVRLDDVLWLKEKLRNSRTWNSLIECLLIERMEI